MCPPKAILVMLGAAVPVLVTVTVWAALDVPEACDPKLRLVELRMAAGLATPVPLRATLWGLEGALSVTAREAEVAPEVTGAKISEMVQLAPALTLEPQVLVSPKYLALAPVMAMLLMLSVALPVFVIVTTRNELVVLRVWLAKTMLDGLNETAGPVPGPVKATDWELLPALSVIVSEALMLPGAVGAKVTQKLQTEPGVRVAVQVLLCTN